MLLVLSVVSINVFKKNFRTFGVQSVEALQLLRKGL